MTKSCCKHKTHLSLTALFTDALNARRLIAMLRVVMSLDATRGQVLARQRKKAIGGRALSIAQKTFNHKLSGAASAASSGGRRP